VCLLSPLESIRTDSNQAFFASSLPSGDTEVSEFDGVDFPDFIQDLEMFTSFGNPSFPIFYPNRANTPLQPVEFGVDVNFKLSDLDMGFPG